MSLIVVASAKGSPGATSTALRLSFELGRKLGSSYPASYLVDADPDGGDVALRLGLAAAPSVATLALAGRHGFSEAVLVSHTQRSALLPGVAILTGVAGRGQRSAVSWLAQPLAEAARRTSLPIVVDAGRTGGFESVHPLYAAADHVVLVCDESTPSVVHARSALIALAAEGIEAGVALAPEAGEPASEIARALGRPILARVPKAGFDNPFAPGRHRPLGARGRSAPGGPSGVGQLAEVLAGEARPLAEPAQRLDEQAPASLGGLIANPDTRGTR